MSDLTLHKVLRRAATGLARRADAVRIRRDLRLAGVPDAAAIPTYTTPAELALLYELGRACPGNARALEIGSYVGASACYIAAGLRRGGGTLYCVDTWQNQTMPSGERDTFAEFSRNTSGLATGLIILRKPSATLTRADVPEPLDFIFIDADHTYQSVKADFERVSPWLSEKGVIALHDHAEYIGVARTIGEALISGRWTVSAQVENLLCLRRAKYVV